MNKGQSDASRTDTRHGQNRLVQCVYNGIATTHTYGSDGLRRRTVQGGVTTDYVLDGQSVVRTLRNGAVDKTWLHGPRGPEYERDAAGNVVWYLYDGLGSVIGTVDPAGNLVSTRKYDVYGAVRWGTGPAGPKHRFVGGLGHPSEEETGLIYMRARYYDPVTGRFVSEDPAQHGTNWFAYAMSDPVNGFDLDGRVTLTAVLQSMSIGALSGLVSSAVNELLVTGRVTFQNVFTWTLIGALAGAGFALTGGYAATLGSFIEGASLAQFAKVALVAIGVMAVASAIGTVVAGLLLHNMRLGLLMEMEADLYG